MVNNFSGLISFQNINAFKDTQTCSSLPALVDNVSLIYYEQQKLIVLKQRWYSQFSKFVVGFSVLRQIYRIFGCTVQQPLINLQFWNTYPKILVLNSVQNDQIFNASKPKPQLNL
ncbi:Hypothetical_protein [Hexamita inflata]|uniref:Hypothetical_protein n=1 Tax=Hexamita inflata TaxID=28002 RepID=A0AA86UR31_9EUKA|nr:Hypothetical protein HINF_LOCUS35163 [Hexamita inflata]